MSRRAAVAIVAGMVLMGGIGSIGGYALGQYDARTADITVMPCSAWADTAKPVIPPFTFAGACVTEDGHLSTP